MVNKVALGILAVIILTAMTVGGLVGLQLNGEGSLGEGTPTPTLSPTPQPSPETPEPTPTAGAGSTDDETPTPTSTPTPDVRPSDLDRRLIEEEVRLAINDRRDDRDMDSLRADETIREMARNHSRTMAEQGYVAHWSGGLSTQDRYEAFDLADRCRIPDNSNRGIRTGEALETLYKVNLGDTHTFEERNETTQEWENRTVRLGNETQVARAVVDVWFDRENERRKLLLEQASVAGVGVVVTEAGEVYVTTDLC